MQNINVMNFEYHFKEKDLKEYISIHNDIDIRKGKFDVWLSMISRGWVRSINTKTDVVLYTQK